MNLHTEVIGSGEPIVFLHTGLQTGKTELDEQSGYFQNKYQVILPDLRGHGHSVADNLTNYFHASAKDLAETLDKLGIVSAHIAGCSLGALVGLVFAKRYPEKVKSLILSGIIPEKPVDWEEMIELDAINEAELVEKKEIVKYFNRIWTRYNR